MNTRDLIRGIVSSVEGHSRGEPQRATLATTLNTTATSLSLTSINSTIPPGVIEIGMELMWLETYNRTDSIGTVAAWGRGYSGTSKYAHTAPAEVVVHPRVPKFRVLTLINQVMDGFYPFLFRPQTTITTIYSDSDLRLVPSSAAPVAVNVLRDGVTLRNGRHRWGNGFLRMGTDLVIADEVSIVTPEPATHLTGASWLNDADFATATGLASSVAGLVELGVLARLFAGIEGSRVQPDRTESSDRAQVVPATAGSSLAKLYQSLYQQRMDVEMRAQNERYPLTLTWSR